MKQVALGCQTLATPFAKKAIMLLTLLKLEQELEKEIKKGMKSQRVTLVKFSCARREEVEDCLTFSATLNVIFRSETSCEEIKGCYTRNFMCILSLKFCLSALH